jgi:hypothetical protein
MSISSREELLFLQQSLDVGAVEALSFIEKSLEEFAYRDGVRFANGREILLQRLQWASALRGAELRFRRVGIRTADGRFDPN